MEIPVYNDKVRNQAINKGLMKCFETNDKTS